MADTLFFSEEEALLNWASHIGSLCQGTELILLSGELGAGKTTFTKGLASGMGLKDLVTSPTFTYLNIYEQGPLRLCHYDLYRIHSPEDLEALGFYDYLGEAVIAVEWPDKARRALPDDYVEIDLFFDPYGRRVSVTFSGTVSLSIKQYLESNHFETAGH